MNKNAYIGITISSNSISLSKEFCSRYVKENKFVSPRWNAEEEILELTFYLTDSEISFRIPLKKYSDKDMMCAASSRFCSLLRQFKMGRHEVSDIDISRSGIVTLKFKVEREK